MPPDDVYKIIGNPENEHTLKLKGVDHWIDDDNQHYKLVIWYDTNNDKSYQVSNINITYRSLSLSRK